MSCLCSCWQRPRDRSPDLSDLATPETVSTETKKQKKWRKMNVMKLFRKKCKEELHQEGEGRLEEVVKAGKRYVMEVLLVLEKTNWANGDAGRLEISYQAGDSVKVTSQAEEAGAEALKRMERDEAGALDEQMKADLVVKSLEERHAEADALNLPMKLQLEKNEARALEQMKFRDSATEALNHLMELHLKINQRDKARVHELQKKDDLDEIVRLLEPIDSESQSEANILQNETENADKQVQGERDPSNSTDDPIKKKRKRGSRERKTNKKNKQEVSAGGPEDQTKTMKLHLAKNERGEDRALEQQMKADEDVELLELGYAEAEALNQPMKLHLEKNERARALDKQMKADEDVELLELGYAEAEALNQPMKLHLEKDEVQGEKENGSGNSTDGPIKKKRRRGTRGRGRKINHKKNKQEVSAGGSEDLDHNNEAV